MSDTKHADEFPRPWTVAITFGRQEIRDATGHVLLTGPHPEHLAGRSIMDLVVCIANAHDDLLAACEEFIRFADLPGNSVPRGDYIRYQVAAISAARAAIAKATPVAPDNESD